MGFANQATSVKFTRRSASLKATMVNFHKVISNFEADFEGESGIRWYVPGMSAVVTDNTVLFLQKICRFRQRAPGK